MKISNRVKNRISALFLALSLILTMGVCAAPPATAATATSISKYNTVAKPVVDAFRSDYDGSPADKIVGRAIWYMEYGFMKYGHYKYPATGYIDCSNFVSLVYKDFGYPVTSACRNYNQVGTKVSGVYVKNGVMYGTGNLKPGDIFTFQRTTYISHVAMYVGMYKGEPCFIGTTKGFPTCIGIVRGFKNWYGDQFHSVRRVLPASAFKTTTKVTDRGPVIPAKYQIKPTKTIVMPSKLTAGF
ncbi:MAG: NlpC/P60 family protein [Syntrophomonadaceae bacterium]